MTPPTITSRDETRCAAPGCAATLTRRPRGRPAIYCSPACRTAAHRKHQTRDDQPLIVEVDHGSTSSKDRPSGRVWMIRLRRGNRSVILIAGLGRASADTLAAEIRHVIDPAGVAEGDQIE